MATGLPCTKPWLPGLMVSCWGGLLRDGLPRGCVLAEYTLCGCPCPCCCTTKLGVCTTCGPGRPGLLLVIGGARGGSPCNKPPARPTNPDVNVKCGSGPDCIRAGLVPMGVPAPEPGAEAALRPEGRARRGAAGRVGRSEPPPSEPPTWALSGLVSRSVRRATGRG